MLTGLAIALGFLIGASLGVLGSGGSILTVPIFVYIAGYEPQSAIAMSLAVVGTTSLVGAWRHWRSGNSRPRIAVVFGLFSMAGSYLGAKLGAVVSDRAQLILFGVVMLLAATSMLRSGTQAASAPRHTPLPLFGLIGVTAGTLSGLVGIGGGFLIVPALVVLSGLGMREAVGSSLLVIAMNAATGFAGYLTTTHIDPPFMLAFLAVSIAGIVAGERIGRGIPAGHLKKGFAVFLLVVGVGMVIGNW